MLCRDKIHKLVQAGRPSWVAYHMRIRIICIRETTKLGWRYEWGTLAGRGEAMTDRDTLDSNQDSDGSTALAGARPSIATPARWHLCHLPFAYQILIWAARTWNNEDIQPGERWSMITQAFAKLNAEDATLPFLRLMDVIHTGALHSILIGDGGCAVFADEIRLIEVIAAAVRGDCSASNKRLRQMLAPGAARVAWNLVADIATALQQAGLNFGKVRTMDKPVPGPPMWALH